PSILEKAKAVLAGADFKETIATPVMILRFRELGGMLKNETIADDKEAWARTMADLSKSLMEVHGVKFSKDNLKHMVKFAEMTPDMETAARWTRNLCWTAVIQILRLGDGDIVKTGLWADKAITERIPLSELRIMSSLEIANRQKQAAENKVEAKEAVNDNKAEAKEAVNDNKVKVKEVVAPSVKVEEVVAPAVKVEEVVNDNKAGADVPENKVMANNKPVEPKAKPVAAKQQPVVEPKPKPPVAKQKPVELKPKPAAAKQQPVVAKQQPVVEPKQQPAEPKQQPVAVKPKPVEPKQQPVEAKQKPAVEPKQQLVAAKQQPAVEPKQQPVAAKPKPVEPKSKPVAAKPKLAEPKQQPVAADSKAKPSVPEDKAPASVPELKKAAFKTWKARDKNRRVGSAGRKTAGSADKQAGRGA
ncbi:MAG: hypothetical protein LBO05_12425, partial [Deltaproteobacteria bacterium]|nr:hypothetical protein [Deltaproteobacteria bacterium]